MSPTYAGAKKYDFLKVQYQNSPKTGLLTKCMIQITEKVPFSDHQIWGGGGGSGAKHLSEYSGVLGPITFMHIELSGTYSKSLVQPDETSMILKSVIDRRQR
jgi:hypothetical protein